MIHFCCLSGFKWRQQEKAERQTWGSQNGLHCTLWQSVEIVSKKIQKVQLVKVQYPTRQHLTKTVTKTFMKKPLTKFPSPPTARLSHYCLGEGKALGLLTLVYKILSHCREIVKFVLSHQVSASLSLWSNHRLKQTNYSHCSGVLSLFEPANDVPTSFHTFKLWCKRQIGTKPQIIVKKGCRQISILKIYNYKICQ